MVTNRKGSSTLAKTKKVIQKTEAAQDTLWVAPSKDFSDGTIPGAAAWKRGVYREVTMPIFKQLRASTTLTWKIRKEKK